jgi:hypothetical protein
MNGIGWRPTRRTAVAALSAVAASAQEAVRGRSEHDFLGLKHYMPEKPDEIAMLVYPGMTALDLVGPQQVFGYLMGAKVHMVWKSKEPVASDTGLTIVPTEAGYQRVLGRAPTWRGRVAERLQGDDALGGA